jgi:hypothetical protein
MPAADHFFNDRPGATDLNALHDNSGRFPSLSVGKHMHIVFMALFLEQVLYVHI